MHGQSTSSGPGVRGVSASGVGVQGDGSTGVLGNSSSVGVWGAATGSGIGVRASAGSGVGVYGTSTSQVGVLGLSTSYVGVFGQTSAASPSASYAVWGNANGLSSVGVYGSAIPGATAGVFDGPVSINGTLTVYGGINGAKSAAVPHPDGTFRRLYCMESPESFFEDFGSGALVGGRAQILIEPEFAATVKTDDYSVFLTPEGDCRGLYVTTKTPTGFEVRELQGGTSSIPFRYRVVAHRKDVTAPRLERLAAPPPRPHSPTIPDPLTLPPTPATP